MSRNLTSALADHRLARVLDGRISAGGRRPARSSVPAPPRSAATGNG